jgi:hypothetical protein
MQCYFYVNISHKLAAIKGIKENWRTGIPRRNISITYRNMPIGIEIITKRNPQNALLTFLFYGIQQVQNRVLVTILPIISQKK